MSKRNIYVEETTTPADKAAGKSTFIGGATEGDEGRTLIVVQPPTAATQSAPDYIDLDQAAALVNRGKKTLERALADQKMPSPDVEGGGGKKHEWVYLKLKPWLEKTYGRILPDRPPHTIR